MRSQSEIEEPILIMPESDSDSEKEELEAQKNLEMALEEQKIQEKEDKIK